MKTTLAGLGAVNHQFLVVAGVLRGLVAMDRAGYCVEDPRLAFLFGCNGHLIYLYDLYYDVEGIGYPDAVPPEGHGFRPKPLGHHQRAY